MNTSNSITPNYRYSTQGQEKQTETGWSSYKWRNYDAAMGRFFNVDPLSEKYNTWSTYAFSGNRVIDARELEGLEPYVHYNTLDDAAENFAVQYNSTSIVLNVELGTTFYAGTTKDGKTYYSYVQPQGQINYDINGIKIPGTSALVDLEIPEETTKAGDGHSHAADMAGRKKNYVEDDNKMSSQDIYSARGSGDWSKRSIQYVVTPNGQLIIYDPNPDAPGSRKNRTVKTSTPIPSDPLSPTRKNKQDPTICPTYDPLIIDSNGQVVVPKVQEPAKEKNNNKIN
ncbi:DUF4329 domain-containing protein [Chryseobacterium sp. MA9]|uniref:DUF4329 domain-containing protein n=1 Tax=Chryseobacterium sp. MA9 TaxID=2966625 RepID=UPI0021045CD7|nr:DUF4329 domain-containing protein [Chryseobacterium sp. MA9]